MAARFVGIRRTELVAMVWVAMIWQWVLSCLNGLLDGKPARSIWSSRESWGSSPSKHLGLAPGRSPTVRTRGPTYDDPNSGATTWNWNETVMVWLHPRLCLVAVQAARRARVT